VLEHGVRPNPGAAENGVEDVLGFLNIAMKDLATHACPHACPSVTREGRAREGRAREGRGAGRDAGRGAGRGGGRAGRRGGRKRKGVHCGTRHLPPPPTLSLSDT